MRISQFTVQNKRSVANALCPSVPKLMIITGPNGSGKSTLLYELRNNNGRNNILYVGPHRSSRRQNVQQKSLISGPILYENILSQDQYHYHFEGMQPQIIGRDPWNSDDAANLLKHSLCQIEIERQQAIAARYDLKGEIPKGTFVDSWAPLRELTEGLLPHLRFLRIDNTNRDRVRCLWSVHSKNIEVDLDDLSSGEKSVIQMFFPFLEHQMRGLLNQSSRGSVEAERPDTCVLIDEPELHLHPNLQMKVLDYLRILSGTGKTQVIIVTHSPTIVEHASFEELFLLRPVELVAPSENQLIQIANNEERLLALRDVFGTTSNATAMQPIVIVEGISQTGTSATLSDRKLYRMLSPRFDRVTLLPSGGKSECLKLLKGLNELLPAISNRLQAVALLDRDISEAIEEPNVHLLPVSMLENFLLDPAALWESMQSVIEKTGFATIEDLTTALDSVLGTFEPQEIERRVKAKLGTHFFRPESPVEQVPAQATRVASDLLESYSAVKVRALCESMAGEIKNVRQKGQRRELFHGKEVLDVFYKKHLKNTGFAKDIFKFETARHASKRKSVTNFFESFFAKIGKTQNEESPA